MLGRMRNDRRRVSGIHISMCAYEHPDGLMRGVFHRHQLIRVLISTHTVYEHQKVFALQFPDLFQGLRSDQTLNEHGPSAFRL